MMPFKFVLGRVQKNPGFLKKPNGWVFFGFYRVLLGFFGCAVPAAVSKHGKGK